jgi:hypothetical protein
MNELAALISEMLREDRTDELLWILSSELDTKAKEISEKNKGSLSELHRAMTLSRLSRVLKAWFE